MAWIKTINENQADEKLQQIYQDIMSKRGKISNIFRIHSLLPDTLISHQNLYQSLMFNKSSIKREMKEFIAVIVSQTNHCNYCINHHTEALSKYWKDKKKIRKLHQNKDLSFLEETYKTIGVYAKKLTKNPSKIKKSDIKILKKIGLIDDEILEITLIIAYFNFVNRIALALNVNLTEADKKGYNY